MDVLQRCQEIKAQVEVELASATDEQARIEILVQGLYRLSDQVLAEMGRPIRSESYREGRGAILDLIVFLCLPLVRGGRGQRDLLRVLAEVAEATDDPLIGLKLSTYSRQLLAQSQVSASRERSTSLRRWCLAWGALLSLGVATTLFLPLNPLQKSAVLSRDGGTPQETEVSHGRMVAPAPPGWRDQESAVRESIANRPAPAHVEKVEQVTRIRVVANQVLVPVTVRNGAEVVKVTLLLDTGSTRTALSEQFAGRLGIDLNRARGSLVEVADGRTLRARLATVDTLSVGARAVPSFEMEFYPYSGSDQGFDGFLGMDFLGKQRYQIDVENEVIRWF